ncbi:hypothetical protein BGW39_003646 [Mortierella sp. 14UC]|nr:hypothetical protein BGW39_003646 [Mortierella sp. 14UC]
MPQTAESRAGSFSDLDLIKKRVQERKNWRQIAEELGQPAQDLRVRYYALEPWLKEGMGHRSSAVRAQLLSGFAKNVDDIFEAMVQDESGLSLETVQGWYDRALVRADRARHRVSGMRVEPLPRVIRMVESQLHKHKRIERYYTGQDWTQLLGLTSRTLSVKKWKRLQLKWLTQNSAWSDRAETLLIQQVLRRGVGAWDDIATALNTDARMNIKDKREKPSRIFTPAECSIHWKNLDMPVQRAFDSREWTAPTKQAFWLAWSRRNKERKDRIMGGPGGDQQFWNIVADDMRMPGGGEQCLVYFEDSIQGLSTLDDRGISDHADQQVQDAREKSSRQVISLRPKHWSLVLQDLVRKADIKQGRIYSTPGEVGGWKAVVDQIREYERSSKQWTLDEAVNKTTFDGVLWHWRRIHRQSGPPWSQSELKLLEQGIRECGYHWKVICQRYLPWRTSTMMRPRWYLLPDCAARITVEEYETLLQAVGEQRRQARVGSVSVDDVDWSRIAARMPGWSADPCRRVYESSFRFLMEQTKFTAEEDQWLLQNISSEKDQSQNWKAAVDHFPASGISAWQYRLRWCQLTDAAVP